MTNLRNLLTAAEESVHNLVDRTVLFNAPNNNGAARRRAREDDNESYNPRPRNRRTGENAPIPCCDCSKWGTCSLLRPNKGCPCVVAKRACTAICREGCTTDCQNQAPWPAQISGEDPPPDGPPVTAARTPHNRRIIRRSTRTRNAPPGTGLFCPPALPTAPNPPSTPDDNTTTPIATPAIRGDDSAATTTATDDSTTEPPTTTAEGGGGGEPSAAAVDPSQSTTGDGGNENPPDTEATAEGGGDDTPPEVNATEEGGNVEEPDAGGGEAMQQSTPPMRRGMKIHLHNDGAGGMQRTTTPNGNGTKIPPHDSNDVSNRQPPPLQAGKRREREM